jgi:Family of unknown function (DUF5681)
MKGRPPPADPDADEELKVGYGRPPVHSRFKPGRSGNPRGRPKGRPSKAALLGKMLNEKITIRQGDRVRKVSVYEAMFYVQVRNAVKGDPKAFATILRIIEEQPHLVMQMPTLVFEFTDEKKEPILIEGDDNV